MPPLPDDNDGAPPARCHLCHHEVLRLPPEQMPQWMQTCECRCHVPWRIVHAVRHG